MNTSVVPRRSIASNGGIQPLGDQRCLLIPLIVDVCLTEVFRFEVVVRARGRRTTLVERDGPVGGDNASIVYYPAF